MVSVGELIVVDDVSPARWLTERIRSFACNVGSLVPATFDAYARVLHPARRYHGAKRPLVRWAEIARANGKIAHPQMQFTRLLGYASRFSAEYCDTQPELFEDAPEVGMLAPDDAASLARTLAGHTTATGHCWFAVWEGRGGLNEAFADRPTFQLPHRNYHLAHGPLAAAAQSVGTDSGPFGHISCNLWWPDDHAWCVATEIDLDSTYVGASEACIEGLLENSELEVLRVSVDAGIAADSDTLNPASATDRAIW